MFFVLCFVLAYLVGSLSPGAWIARYRYGVDLFAKGSGASGATNVFRLCGRKAGVTVFALDILKGALPIWFLRHNNCSDPLVITAAVGIILGHSKSIFLRFKGGKAAATGLGILIILAPPVCTVYGLTAFILGYWGSGWLVSVGTMTAAIIVIISVLRFDPNPHYTGFIVSMCLVIIALHYKNIRRIWKGAENPTPPRLKRQPSG